MKKKKNGNVEEIDKKKNLKTNDKSIKQVKQKKKTV